jgi:hypothetical protein
LALTIRDKVPSENIIVGTLFLTVISKGTSGIIFYLELVSRKKGCPIEIHAIK